jgi:uncharacterized protein (DUF697 family)
MPPTVQVGAILIEAWPAMSEIFGIESEPYSGSWSVVKALNGFALDRKIRAVGWNFFFMAAENNATFLGAPGADKIHNALTRILEKVRGQDFNCLEVTAIVGKHFLGVPYTTVSAHSRHIQQSCNLDAAEARRA